MIRPKGGEPKRSEDKSRDYVEAYRSTLVLPGCSRQQSRILEAGAVAAYHAQMEFQVIGLLLCDDASQFEKFLLLQFQWRA